MLKALPQVKVLGNKKTYVKKYFQGFSSFYRSKKRKSQWRKKSEIYIARLEQAELVSQMAAGVANEIRNPLTIVSGYIQLLRNRTELNHLRNYFTAMEEAIKQTDCLIDDFLTIAQDKEVQLALVDLNQVILEIVPTLEAKAKRTNCRINVELGTNVPMLIDTKEIRQLVKILVENGLEAMSKGGELTIKTYLEKGEVVLAIRDQGKGIPPELINRLGTPFLTTKDGASGLGLAICQGIVARHEASIYFKTGRQGTTFYIHFPLSNNKNQIF